MKIDGVSVEPGPSDDPFAMGPVALDIDCDLDALAQKVSRAVGYGRAHHKKQQGAETQHRSSCVQHIKPPKPPSKLLREFPGSVDS